MTYALTFVMAKLGVGCAIGAFENRVAGSSVGGDFVHFAVDDFATGTNGFDVFTMATWYEANAG